jgi:putative ABC transport system permease protein
MFKNYILVTLRNLRKNSVYSFINIAGLSIGITCSLLILLWVYDEISFDSLHPKKDRIYQVKINAEYDGKINTWDATPLPTYRGIKEENNNIIATAVTDWGGEHLLAVGDKGINKNGRYASEQFLEIFGFQLLQGNAEQVLDEVHSIVITESTAKALFGDQEPLNQIVKVDNQTELKVTGILKDIPKNSSFQFDFLLNWKMYENIPWVKGNLDNWGNYSWPTYVELNDPSSQASVENSIRDILKRKNQEDIKRQMFLHPLKRWRLYSKFENGKEAGGLIEYVRMFIIIATFILVIACINFMNLATARSEKRAKEVGIRKSIGSRKYELIMQFIGESLFITFIAFIIAILISQLLLPFYNDLVEKQLTIPYGSLTFWVVALTLIFITGIISGSYPAFYLSSFQPVKVLKGKILTGKSGSTPRKILVTLQFGFSIVLIIGTLIIFQQIQYVRNRNLGYEQKNLITIKHTEEIRKNYHAIKNELLQTGVVKAVTKSNSAITDLNSWNFVDWPGKPEGQRYIFATIATEYDYTKTMGIKILEGRDFSEDFKSDTAAVIVNKAAIDLMGLKDPIGTQLDIWGSKRELIGVVDNTLMGSPYETIGPMFMMLVPNWVNVVTVRLEETADLRQSLGKVEAVFKKYTPAYPFEYAFADQEFQKKFTSIEMTSRLASLFASLAIVITGLGLFGLAAFTAQQRTKEIGIRKVLGASVSSLVSLISKDFSRLVIIAFFVSSPVAWWLLDNFLQQYKYRIEIAWWVFPLTGIIALLFALGIVSTQAFRAARSNPVNSLRNE